MTIKTPIGILALAIIAMLVAGCGGGMTLDELRAEYDCALHDTVSGTPYTARELYCKDGSATGDPRTGIVIAEFDDPANIELYNDLARAFHGAAPLYQSDRYVVHDFG